MSIIRGKRTVAVVTVTDAPENSMPIASALVDPFFKEMVHN